MSAYRIGLPELFVLLALVIVLWGISGRAVRSRMGIHSATGAHRRRRPGVLLIAATLAAANASAQQHPDFSGRWTLVSAARNDRDVPLSLGVRQPVARTTALGAPMPPAFLHLTIERTFARGSQTETLNIGVEGGTVGGVVGAGPSRSRFSVRWEDDALVMWSASYSDGSREPATEHRETWELDGEGRLLVTTVDRRANAESVDSVLYRKE